MSNAPKPKPKVVSLLAKAWLQAVLGTLPSRGSVRLACLEQQQDEVKQFERMASGRPLKKP